MLGLGYKRRLAGSVTLLFAVSSCSTTKQRVRSNNDPTQSDNAEAGIKKSKLAKDVTSDRESSNLCVQWQTLGNTYRLYRASEKKHILEHQKYVYSVRLPGNARPTEDWLSGETESECDFDSGLCGPTGRNLLAGPLDIDLCSKRLPRTVRIDSMHLIMAPEGIRPEYAAHDIGDHLKFCGVGPMMTYPVVSQKTLVAHEIEYEESNQSGWCFAEFEHVPPRVLPGESDHIVAFSRFKRVALDELVQVTFMLVAKEKQVRHIRGIMADSARTLKVNWPNLERYTIRSDEQALLSTRTVAP